LPTSAVQSHNYRNERHREPPFRPPSLTPRPRIWPIDASQQIQRLPYDLNDWDLLEPALRSIAPYNDELVVVDGAYDCMAPYLTAHGDALDRSLDRVYDILESSRIPYRAITGTWNTQIDKRKAGYQLCRQRYGAKIDADEVMFFDHDALGRFLSRGGVVAAVEMPYYVAPGRISVPRLHAQVYRAFPFRWNAITLGVSAVFVRPRADLPRRSPE
jgi:hypothetical protein